MTKENVLIHFHFIQYYVFFLFFFNCNLLHVKVYESCMLKVKHHIYISKSLKYLYEKLLHYDFPISLTQTLNRKTAVPQRVSLNFF